MPYTHLTPHERYCIAHMHMAKLSVRLIAARLKRAPSTISRELARNTGKYSPYWYDWAQQYAEQRKAIARHQKRKSHPPLYELVIQNIQNGLSPELICGRLKREYRSDKMRLSPETIYQWVLADAREGGTLYQSLIRHHKRRRRQRRCSRRRLFADRVSIHDRPKIVSDKVRFGDWESDTMEGGKSKGGLATHTEIKSRYLVAGKLIDKRSATFMACSIALFNHIKPELIKTFTVDNGSEFAEFKRLEKATNSQVYFADPHSPWQRGLNENTNGLLRRYFPKGCNFHPISATVIQAVVDKLNHRPRKCLNFRTPYEVLFKTKTVALGT
ncbi:IS30 family transposase [Pseudomonadota bacterium]|nr:IS30 family transposase [Pseudomonadota bacterium]